mgnify:CR=1 FL=1
MRPIRSTALALVALLLGHVPDAVQVGVGGGQELLVEALHPVTLGQSGVEERDHVGALPAAERAVGGQAERGGGVGGPGGAYGAVAAICTVSIGSIYSMETGGFDA